MYTETVSTYICMKSVSTCTCIKIHTHTVYVQNARKKLNANMANELNINMKLV